MEEELQHWESLTSSWSDLPFLKEEVFNLLIQQYSHPERAYHNLRHIKTMLDDAVIFRKQIQDYNSFCLAIWFHDAVYYPLKNNNEDQSAALATTHLSRLLVPEKIIARVSALIMATASHTAVLSQGDSDLDMFLDFDLKILGSRQNEYKQYALQIRKEYAVVPDLVYASGRKKVLVKFLESEKIFRTQAFHSLYELQARENISREIEGL